MPGVIKIGDHFAVSEYILVLIILALTGVAVILTRFLMNRAIRLASEHLNSDPTKYRFLKHMLTATIITLGIGLAIYTIPSLRAIAVSLFAGAGIFTVIIGFASQQAFANIVSGIFIVLFKPFRINDIIEVGKQYEGVVEDITLRHTVIRNWENRRIIIPNSIISNETLINSSIIEEKTCRHLNIGISYDSDIDLAQQIIEDEVAKHPNYRDNRTPEEKAAGEPLVRTRVVALADFSVNIRVYLWAETAVDAFVLSADVMKSIKQRFDREGVEIPFPYRTVVYKKDLPANAVLQKEIPPPAEPNDEAMD